MVDESPSRSLDKFVLRMPDGMRDRLAERAKISQRSMNSEIIAIINDDLDKKERFGQQELLAMVQILHHVKGMLKRDLDEITEKMDSVIHDLDLLDDEAEMIEKPRKRPRGEANKARIEREGKAE